MPCCCVKQRSRTAGSAAMIKKSNTGKPARALHRGNALPQQDSQSVVECIDRPRGTTNALESLASTLFRCRLPFSKLPEYAWRALLGGWPGRRRLGNDVVERAFSAFSSTHTTDTARFHMQLLTARASSVWTPMCHPAMHTMSYTCGTSGRISSRPSFSGSLLHLQQAHAQPWEHWTAWICQ